jgi:hypothetical protein
VLLSTIGAYGGGGKEPAMAMAESGIDLGIIISIRV